MLKKYTYKSENTLITPFYTKNNFKSNNITTKLTHFYTPLKHIHNPFSYQK